MTEMQKKYYKGEDAKTKACKIVRKSATTGYKKAYEAYKFIVSGESVSEKFTPNQMKQLKAARAEYLA